MIKRMLVLTIGYDYYAAEPHDAAVLIETSGRLIKVEAASDYKGPHTPCAEQMGPLTSVQFIEVADAPKAVAPIPEPVAPEQPQAAMPNAIEPAPDFRMTNATASWDDWLKQARHIEEADAPSIDEGSLRLSFDRGKTPHEATSPF